MKNNNIDYRYDDWQIIGIRTLDRGTLVDMIKNQITIGTIPKEADYVLEIQLKNDNIGSEYIAGYKTLDDIPNKSVQAPCPSDKMKKCYFIKYEK
mgnify:CR=1 FL=1